MSRTNYRRAFALTFAAMLAVVALAVMLTRTDAPSAGLDPATGLPQDADERRELAEDLARRRAEQRSEPGPTYWLPEDQRAGWIEAWNRMRDCAQAHGFAGVGPVAPTYGDGRTPAPIISAGAGNADALAACPMDTSLFDQAKVAAAISGSRPR